MIPNLEVPNLISISSTLANTPNSIATVSGGNYFARAIWIQPSSLMEKNREELLTWNPDFKDHHVKVVKGTAKKKQAICADPDTLVWVMTAEAFKSYYGTMKGSFKDIIQIVCDEPHLYYRGFKSARTQFFVNNVADHVRVQFLTATPTPRGKLTSAYIYCHMIQPSYYGCYDWFINTHADLDEYQNPSVWKNHDRLWRFLDNYSICWTTKDMYGDVDEIIIRDVVQMEPKVHKVYREFEDLGIAEVANSVLRASSGGVTSLRCRQMLAHPHSINMPAGWDDSGNVTSWEELNIFSGMTPKLERICDYAEEGEPLIIFGAFTQEINKIAETLKTKGLRVGVIHGQVPQATRNKLDVDFQNGLLDVMVCSAATAGVGFNWGHVDTVIFHSLNYGDDEFLQAVARAKRGIRKNILRIVVLEYENSIDQPVMWAVHHNSRNSHESNHDNPIIYFPTAVQDSHNHTLSPEMIMLSR